MLLKRGFLKSVRGFKDETLNSKAGHDVTEKKKNYTVTQSRCVYFVNSSFRLVEVFAVSGDMQYTTE